MPTETERAERIRAAIERLHEGGWILVADEGGATEGGALSKVDLVLPGNAATAEIINRMITYGHSILYVEMEHERCAALGLELLRERDLQRWITSATVSIEAATGVSTGISAADRARTVRVTADPDTRAEDLVRPGHVIPLAAAPGGVLTRVGRTEATIDLMNLAGLFPVTTCVELMGDDGEPITLENAARFSREQHAPLVYVADVLTAVLESPRRIEILGRAATRSEDWGDLEIVTMREPGSERVQRVVSAAGRSSESSRIHVHVACPEGDVFSACERGCGPRLKTAMEDVVSEGATLLYIDADQHAPPSEIAPLAVAMLHHAGVADPVFSDPDLARAVTNPRTGENA
jgi:3,4-dihydroxy 2-butanone 4-phosphate synthase / GTP cyclohydrolase II